MRERAQSGFREKILKFRDGCWHASEDFVATRARQHNAVSLSVQTYLEMSAGFARVAAGAWSCGKAFFVVLKLQALLRTEINVKADTAAFFFNQREKGTFVPVRFSIVIIGDCIEARRVCGSACEECIGHTDDRR